MSDSPGSNKKIHLRSMVSHTKNYLCYFLYAFFKRREKMGLAEKGGKTKRIWWGEKYGITKWISCYRLGFSLGIMPQKAEDQCSL